MLRGIINNIGLKIMQLGYHDTKRRLRFPNASFNPQELLNNDVIDGIVDELSNRSTETEESKTGFKIEPLVNLSFRGLPEAHHKEVLEALKKSIKTLKGLYIGLFL